MADDILSTLDKRFELGKTNVKSVINQMLILSLVDLLIAKNLVTTEEIVNLINETSDKMDKRIEIAESLMPDQTAGGRAAADKRKRRIRKEFKILLQRFES